MTAEQSQAHVVQRVFASAGIPPERVGSARLTPLDDQERTLYRRILTGFARADPPDVSREAADLGLPYLDTLNRFAQLDLAHRDPASGAITVAYPFSARPRGHTVLINGTHGVEAMCAIDAVGIAPMLELPITISSRDPLTSHVIEVRVDPGGDAECEPSTAVVLAGSAHRDAPSFRSCCGVLNFFESSQSATTYLTHHPELTGFPITIPDAVEAGRALFGDLLKEP